MTDAGQNGLQLLESLKKLVVDFSTMAVVLIFVLSITTVYLWFNCPSYQKSTFRADRVFGSTDAGSDNSPYTRAVSSGEITAAKDIAVTGKKLAYSKKSSFAGTHAKFPSKDQLGAVGKLARSM